MVGRQAGCKMTSFPVELFVLQLNSPERGYNFLYELRPTLLKLFECLNGLADHSAPGRPDLFQGPLLGALACRRSVEVGRDTDLTFT